MKRTSDKKNAYLGWLSFLTFVLLLSPLKIAAQETYRFQRMWPTLQQPWYFSNPSGVAVDSNNFLYVADTENNRIMKFTSDGQFVAEWGKRGEGDGEFSDPCGIAVGGEGYVFVADTGNHRIQKFTSEGRFLAKWGTYGSGDREFIEPSGLAVDSTGSVYVADTGNSRIQKFSADGQFAKKWGAEGSANGLFNRPSGIAIDTQLNVHVADTGNNRIQRFTLDGEFVARWGVEGEGNGEFYRPYGITVDNSGYVYVGEESGARIQKFTFDGRFRAAWGTYGSRNGEFWNPRGIAVDNNAHIYVADTDNNRIQIFTSTGHFRGKFASSGSENGEFIQPSGIALDHVGNVYVADSWNSRIQKFSGTGEFLSKWGRPGDGDGEFSIPSAIAIDANGYVYVADLDDHIQKFTPDGRFVTKWGSYGSNEGQLYHPNGIACDSNGYLYVVDTDNYRVQKFTTNGLFVTSWGTQGTSNGQFIDPMGVSVDSNNYVYVTDTGNRRIQKFTPLGEFVTAWGTRGDGDGEFESPAGIAVDSYDHVYVTDLDNHRIQKFTSEGVFITKWGSKGYDPGAFFMPSALAVSSDGVVYISERGNNRIQTFYQGITPPPGQKVDKVIIVAGGGPFAGNNLWSATEMLANFAYRSLTYQGFTKQTIYYLSADRTLDLDGNGTMDDVDADATNANLQAAISTWVQDANNLFIYLVDHGGAGTFRMGETELLQASELDTWLDTAQETITGRVILVYDACRSGSFQETLIPPSGKERIILTSTSSEEEAIFSSQGSVSFSFFFWGRMFLGDSFYDSFVNAKNSVAVTYNQNPLLDGNGNGVGNERQDQDIARAITVGNETRTGADMPSIGSISPAQTLRGQSSALIYATNVTDADGVRRVWAVITPPGYSPGAPGTPVTDLPTLEMTSVGNNRYEGTYTTFTQAGTYNLAIYAVDTQGIISLPKQTTVTQEPPLNVSSLSTGLSSPPAVNTPVTITFTSQGNGTNPLYYQYWLASGYQTANYGNWQRLKDWSTDPTLTWTPTVNDHYVIVAYVGKNSTSGVFQQAGLSLETQGNSSSPIVINDFITTMSYPQSSGTPITLTTTATGGNGPLNYKYWYCKGIGGTWNVIREYSTSRSCTWIPTQEGLYTVVVWVTDDTSVSEPPIAGMTCTIGE